MRRRPATIAVSLFPFLAVLLCAMGALILLLVVLTRQIREDVIRSTVVDAPVAPDPVSVVQPKADPIGLSEPPKSIPKLVVTITPPAPEPLPDPNDGLQERLSSLTGTKEILLAETEGFRQIANQRRNSAEAAQARLSAAQLELDAARQRLSAREAENRDREQERDRFKRLLEKAQGTLSTALAAAETAEPKVSIVPYDGRSGTPRRPILIECTADAIRFIPEDVSLSAGDLEGFHPDFNPLLAGAIALREYWRDVDGGASPQPYVLLLVHDDGVAAYYAARSLLRSLGGETGYELVTDDLKIALPEEDPLAGEVCRAAVLELLNDRSAALAAAGRQIDEPLFPTGRFEVDPRDHDPINSNGLRPFGSRSFARVPPLSKQSGSPKVFPTRAEQPPRDAMPSELSSRFEPSVSSHLTASSPAGSVAEQAAQQQQQTENRSNQSQVADRLLKEAMAEQWPDFRERNRRQKGWGTSAPTATISLERPVAVTVFSDRIEVGMQPAVPVGDSGVTLATVDRVLDALRAEADSWGKAPGDFYWTPKVQAVIEPGGMRHFDRMRGRLTGSGLRVTDRIALAPATPNFLELDHAAPTP